MLQDDPIELVVWDKDVYTTDDVIGVVYIDASNLLLRAVEDPSHVPALQGWFPIFDTLEGARGELHVEVRLDKFIHDMNPNKSSSAGVHFFSVSRLPGNVAYHQFILDFVEELGK